MRNQRIPPQHRDELADLFRRHSNSVYRRAYLLTRREAALAEDLVQESFLAVAQVWSELRSWDESRVLARLQAIVANKAIDEFRHEEVCRKSMTRLCPSPPLPADDEAIANAEVEKVWKIMRQLPSGDYMVAVLRWECGMLQREIAEQLHMPQGTVATALRRIRSVIGEALLDARGGWADESR